jgi:class 3 adenylate cyclase
MASKNLSIMITDLQGYSTKSAEATRSELISLVQAHNNLLRPVIDFYKGTIIKSLGDSFLCTFESATDAAVCAIAIQIVTREYNQRMRIKDGGLKIRVAVSTGDVSIEEGDIFGEAVNLASRMEKIPEISDGGIAMNEATYLLVNQQEIHAESIGEHQFKGISQPVRVYLLDLRKQKLDKLPTRLLELVSLVADGKNLPVTGKLKKYFAEPRWRLAGAAAVCALLLFLAAPMLMRRGPNAQEDQILGYIQVTFMKIGPKIEEKDWPGTPEMFREVADQSKVITPVEIESWAKKKGFALPRPR